MKFFPLIVLLITSISSHAQSPFPYEEIKLERPSDYKDAEPLALSAANFLLSTPYKKDDPSRSKALSFLINWMSGTKDYQFVLNDIARGILDDRELFSLFNVAMAKFALENKALSVNHRLVLANSYKTIIDYADKPQNNFKLKSKVRKQLE